MYKKFVKRFFDITISAFILIATSPIILTVVILLSISNEGKVFFRQVRIGRNNKPFTIVKFRSMNDKRNKEGSLLKDVERLTKIGKFIRKTSLDELPQLINVLRGEMSIVGPRPLLPEYLPYYSEYHVRRHEVRPGITGLAQTEGRSTLTFGQRFNYDVEYVEKLSLTLDIRIITKTLLKILSGTKDIQLGVRPMSEIDDIGITKGLAKNYFNVDEKQ